MARDGYRIIDSDLHVHEPHDLYLKYMDPRWGKRIPRAEQRGGRPGSLTFTTAEGKLVRTQAPSRTRVPGPPLPKETLTLKRAPVYADYTARDYDAPSQIMAMDKEGIDKAVLFRTFPLCLDETQELDYSMDLCRAWNSWAHDFASYNPERLKVAALMPIGEVEAMTQEAERAVKELGAVALCISPEPVRGLMLHDELMDVFWRVVERLNVPICVHPSGTSTLDHISNRFVGHANQSVLAGAFAQPLENVLAAATLSIGGVFQRFPKLKVAFLEGNSAWLPWLLYRVDHRWNLSGSFQPAQLDAKPSEYLLRQGYFHVDVDEYLVPDTIERVGDDVLVISTDYPHPDAAFPHAMDEFFGIQGLSAASRRKLLWDNPARLYGL